MGINCKSLYASFIVLVFFTPWFTGFWWVFLKQVTCSCHNFGIEFQFKGEKMEAIHLLECY